MAQGFSLKDQLFNAQSIGQLAEEYAAGLPGFDAAAFQAQVLSGLQPRGLLECLDWMADCLEPRLAPDFPIMAAQLEAMMPAPLDPGRRDDDFGQFIHAVPGILAVRHGLKDHRERALDLLHAATRRFSMEFYIRPFLDRWPEATLARLARWAEDDNYHVRRLVSEGTRPRLPWARALRLSPEQTLPLLDRLHGDPTRYVTRSVANHLNDLGRTEPDLVADRLERWAGQGRQAAAELAWMTRHALRTRLKAGDPRALRLLGFDPDARIDLLAFEMSATARIGGTLEFTVTLRAPRATGALVDYLLWRPMADGRQKPKVYKLRQVTLRADAPLTLRKSHRLKGDATTFTLRPGGYRVGLQVNGRVLAERTVELV